MNTYEQKQADKKEGLRAAATRRRQRGEEISATGFKMLDAIPFGQPILVDHHSEKSDRSYRRRAGNKIDRGIALAKEADELDSRADSVGTGGISSDDPEAVVKLKEKLSGLQKNHADMVAVSKAYRAFKKNPATLETAPISDKMKELVRTWTPPYSFIKAPFSGYQLSNSSANIRNVEKRIGQLLRHEVAPAWGPYNGPGWTAKEDKEDNRFVFKFDGIPAPETRALLKSRGFKWSPTRGAWVRQATGNGRFAADRVVAVLTPAVDNT